MRPFGGTIGVSRSPSTDSAPGVWDLREQERMIRLSTWQRSYPYTPIPVMTSATTPSGVVSDNGILAAGLESWKAFNKAVVSGDTTFYASPSPPTNRWIQYDYGFESGAARYELTSRQANPYGSTQAPVSWTLSGSNDGTNFTVVDTRTSQTWTPTGQTRSFTLSTPQVYRYWRWTWTATNSEGAVVLPKIQLF